jgi:enamine deaminase RidA (YjgF/YER057c/UK114 family)
MGETLVRVSDRLARLALELPPAPVPVGAYVTARRTGALIYASGQTPTVDGRSRYCGRVGAELDIEAGYQAARLAMLNCLAAVKALIGDLDNVAAIVKVNGYVRSAPGFGAQPKVIDGASDLLEALFGERGRHARTSIGVSELPGGAVVEVELIVEIAAG